MAALPIVAFRDMSVEADIAPPSGPEFGGLPITAVLWEGVVSTVREL
jgi:hypothetical protein